MTQRRAERVRLYRLPQAKARRVAVTFLTLLFVATCALVLGPRWELLPTALAAAFGVVAALAAFDRHAVVIGIDGVLYRDGLSGRFARYASIAAVAHLPPGTEENPEAHWVVELRLKNGSAIRIGTGLGDDDGLGAAIARRVRRQRRRVLAEAENVHVEQMLLRADRDVQAWRAELERIGEEARQAYRSAVGPDDLWLVLCDDGALLTARVGAALALGSPVAMKRLRRVAEGLADPVARGVLRTVARKRGAWLEALEALYDRGVLVPAADGGRWARVR